MDLSTIKNTGNWGSSAANLNENFSKVGLEVDKLKYAAYNSKLYATEALLKQAVPSPKVGDWAIVGDSIPGEIYQCRTDGVWTATGQTGGGYGMEVTNITEVGDVTNMPDDEDLISEEKPEGLSVLKFADKAYNASAFSGMGRAYLRKNMVASKNVLTQAMVGSANTRYIIQYDYDLNGQTITVPERCTLVLDGGSVTNGELVLNGTKIEGTGIISCVIRGTVYSDGFNCDYLGSDTLDIDKIQLEDTILHINKKYTINRDTIIPSKYSLRFNNSGMLYVAEGKRLSIYGKVIADEDMHIFDAYDEPTNYSNRIAEVPVETSCPISLVGDRNFNQRTNKRISVKWFGATGLGYDQMELAGKYYSQDALPVGEYVDDTKAIRLALTAIAANIEQMDAEGSRSCSNILYFPAGNYCVRDTLYVSSGTSLMGDIQNRPVRNTRILQTDTSKDLFVLQSQGVGGIGGGGSTHVFRDLTVGFRSTNVQHAGTAIFKFEDNLHNLDSEFTNIRINGLCVRGAVFYANKKNARASDNESHPEYGYGNNESLAVQIHVNNCMFDVAQGAAFESSYGAAFRAIINNCQFFEIWQSVVVSRENSTGFSGKDNFQFYNCEFQNCGHGDWNEPVFQNTFYFLNSVSSLIVDTCYFRCHTSGPYTCRFYLLGGDTHIIRNNTFVYKNSDNANGKVQNIIEAHSSFGILDISGNYFDLDCASEEIIYITEDTKGKFVKIYDNTFADSQLVPHTIRVNTSAGYIDADSFIVIKGNIFGEPKTSIFYGSLSVSNAVILMDNVYPKSKAANPKNTYSYAIRGQRKEGNSEQRPDLYSWQVGFTYYDTTLGKTIVWNGTKWVVPDYTDL